MEQPDILAVITPEGLSQVPSQLRAMDESQTVYVVPGLADKIETRARKVVFNFDQVKPNNKSLAVMTAAAISAGQRAEIAQENLKAAAGGDSIL